VKADHFKKRFLKGQHCQTGAVEITWIWEGAKVAKQLKGVKFLLPKLLFADEDPDPSCVTPLALA